MLDEAEIRKEIARLEYEESSYPNYAKLANLYVIRDKMQGAENARDKFVGYYSGAPAPVRRTGYRGRVRGQRVFACGSRERPGEGLDGH